MKFDTIILCVNMHRLTKSNIRFDFKMASVLPPAEWKRRVCRAPLQQRSTSSWSIVHLFLFYWLTYSPPLFQVV